MIKRCAVFTNSKEKAIEKLEEIKNIKNNLVKLWKTRDQLEYHFEDGEIWGWINPNGNQKGYRVCKAWIDKNLNDRILRRVVLSYCTCKKEDIFYF